MKNQMAPSSTNGPMLMSSGMRMLFCGSLMSKLTLAGAQLLGQAVDIVGRDRGVELILGALEMAMHFGALDGGVLHLAAFDLVEQRGVANLFGLAHA
jgi:hypothetical protein